MKSRLSAIMFLVITCIFGHAQLSWTETKPVHSWVNLGMGGAPALYSTTDVFKHGLACGISYNYLQGRMLYTIRGIASGQKITSGGPKQIGSFYELGLMAGRCKNLAHFRFALSGGIGLSHCFKRGGLIPNDMIDAEFEVIEKTMINLICEIQLFHHLENIGLGVTLLGDYNSEKPFWGYLICLQIMVH